MLIPIIIWLAQVATATPDPIGIEVSKLTFTPSDFIINSEPKEIVRIKPTGEIIIAEGAPIDQRAREFFEALRTVWPEMCDCKRSE